MKKSILFLLTVFVFAAIFTGCPTESNQPEQDETGKYPRTIVFDKKTFDAKSKAWKDSGTKNYQFSQRYLQYKSLVCRTTVKNGAVTAREFFWMNNNNPEDTYNNPETFENYVTYDPEEITDNSQREALEQKPNYIDYEFVKGKDKVPYSTIDEVYSAIDSWYKDLSNKDFEAEEIAQALVEVEYMKDYPVPGKFGVDYLTEIMYDAGSELAVAIPCSGWQDEIFDFKILSK